jgi:hypothetical protein
MLKIVLGSVLGSTTSSTYLRRYACGVASPAAFRGKGVLRSATGWAGENDDDFEQAAR